MIKFAANKDKDITLLGLGFCEGNLQLLMENKPICFHGEEVSMPGCDFAIFAGNDWDHLLGRMKTLIEGVYPDTKDPNCKREIAVLDICEGSFYVVPLVRAKPKRVVYAIGFTSRSYNLLRSGTKLSYRVKTVSGETQKGTDVLLFWCQSQKELESEFIREGLITGNTQLTSDGVRQYVLTPGHYRSRN